MKKILVAIILICSAFAIQAQPGKYAGTKKSLINTTYTDSRKIPGLAGWTYLGGSVLSPLDDPERFLVDIFKKGTSYVVFFSIEEDSATLKCRILDVLEIKPVTKGWSIETALCTKNGTDNPWIVAWTKITPTEYMKTHKKAWRFNPDKREIEVISVKGIACLNEGFDLTLTERDLSNDKDTVSNLMITASKLIP